MTDLLPIVFQRGVNESIDARVAPPEVHTVARNVRWRKDGRPSKRYGSVSVDTTPFAARGYSQLPANLIASWNGNPVFGVGGSVRQQAAAGWQPDSSFIGGGTPSVLPGFAPGERDIVVRDESIVISGVSAGYCQGYIVYAWSNGANVFYSVKNTSGATVAAASNIGAGKDPRVISTTNFVYILSKNGTTLNLKVFDPTLPTSLTAAASPGTLDAAADHFDACGRGSDFLITYQSVGNITTKLFTAVAAPVLTQTQNLGAAATETYLGVAGNSTSNIFVATMNTATGGVGYIVYNNGLTASLGGAVANVDVNNLGQPGISILSNTVADIVWGGFVVASESSYMRAARVNAAGVISSGGTWFGVSPISKPFRVSMGSAAVETGYVWVATHNATNGSTKWDSQRAYYLVSFLPDANEILCRNMHAPNTVPWTLGHTGLADVLAMGVGSGFLTPLVNVFRFGNGGTEMRGVDSVTFRSIFESMRQAARDSVVAGRVLQFSGGSLFELNGSLEETCFSHAPVIQSIVGGGGGALSGATNYLYRAVFEYLDAQGRRRRSASSDPFAFASGANTSATLTLKPLFMASALSLTVVHIYRTIAGQGTYHRVTPNTGAPSAFPVGTATISFLDLMSDVTAGGNEFIYSDGGVAENTLAPPSTFMTVCSARVWLAGQLDRCVVTASKILVDGEPTQFSDLDAFSVFLPEKCTGIASIDGTVVAFARERIYFITGDGPNDEGVGSFNPPTELPTDVGCIDWRSVLETSIGVFFQGKRGIYLLPRGFNTPVFIGAEIESTLASFPIVVSATLVTQPSTSANFLGEITARFVVAADESGSSSCVLTYDLRTGGWSVDTLGAVAFGLAGSYSDTFVYTLQSGGNFTGLRSESVGTYSDEGSFIPSSLGTGDVRPFGVAGYGNFNAVVAVGEFRGSSTVTLQVSVDGATADAFALPVTSADAPDGSVYLNVTPKTRKGSAIRVTVADSSGAPSEGFVSQALFIEHELLGKTKPLPTARRA